MKQTTIRRLISIGLLVVLIIIFSLSSPYFLSAANLLEVVRDASVVGIIGVGITFVIITAGIDLSTGSVMALVGMTMANIYQYTTLPIWVMILAGLIMGVFAGFLNGVIVAKLHIPEFIGTLATMSIFRALTYTIAIKDAGGVITSQPMTYSTFIMWGGSIGPVYIVVIALILAIIIGQIVLKYTRFGTSLYAIGANKKAAALSGINIGRTTILAYMVVGLCVGVGAVFTTARLQSTTALLGSGFEFAPIAAAVVGGVALSGGYGDVIGTLSGALFMAVLDNGVLKLHMNAAYQYIIKGAIIILVVMFDAKYNAYMERKKLEHSAKEAAEV